MLKALSRAGWNGGREKGQWKSRDGILRTADVGKGREFAAGFMGKASNAENSLPSLLAKKSCWKFYQKNPAKDFRATELLRVAGRWIRERGCGRAKTMICRCHGDRKFSDHPPCAQTGPLSSTSALITDMGTPPPWLHETSRLIASAESQAVGQEWDNLPSAP